jgi:RNA recognition motif-containing protein
MDSQVVRDKRTGKTKGYGFVSFSNPSDLAAAFKEMNGVLHFTNFCFQKTNSSVALCQQVFR